MISIWFLYRVVRGWMGLNARPADASMSHFAIHSASPKAWRSPGTGSGGPSEVCPGPAATGICLNEGRIPRKIFCSRRQIPSRKVRGRGTSGLPRHRTVGAGALSRSPRSTSRRCTTTEDHAAMLGKMFALAPRLARELGVVNGFRIVVNTGPDGHQEVQHLHVHVMGGPRPWLRGLTQNFGSRIGEASWVPSASGTGSSCC